MTTQSIRMTLNAGKTTIPFRCLAFCLLALVALSSKAYAQNGAESAFQPDRGRTTPGTYSITDIENINLTNGNLNLTIPLASLPPIAGGKLSWTINAVYNSKIWDLKSDQYEADPDHPMPYSLKYLDRSLNGEWTIGAAYQLDEVTSDEEVSTLPCGSPLECSYAAYKYKYFFVTPDGARHELRPLDATPFGGPHAWRIGYYSQIPDLTQTAMRYYSFDGSYLYAIIYPPGGAIQWTVYMKDGTRVTRDSSGIQRIYDANENSIKIYSEIDGGGVGITHYVDESTGREIKISQAPGSSVIQVQYQTVGGTWMTIAVNWGTATMFGLAYKAGDHACAYFSYLHEDTFPVIRSIVLPQTEPGLPGRQFTFSYNSDTTDSVNYQYRPGCGQSPVTVTSASHGWGELSRMITPSGGQVDYSYSLDGVPNVILPADAIPRANVTQKKITHDGGTQDIWTYTVEQTSASVTAPDGSSTVEYFFPHDPARARHFAGSDGKGGLVYRSDRSDKVRVERQWTQKIFDGANPNSPNGLVGFNTLVDTEFTSLMEGGVPVKMSAKKFQYDFNGNVTQVTEYDWFDPALVSRDGNDVPTAVPASATVLRTTTTNYYNPATASSSPNVYAKRPIATVTPLILSAPQQTITGPSQTQFSYDNLAYGTAPTIGNLTKVSAWDDQAGAWRNTTYGYDSYGNKISITDPNNNVTNIVIDPVTHAQPTQVTVNPLNGTGTQTITTVYDYSTGLVTSITDANNKTTTTDYTNQRLGTVDPFGRPGVVTGPQVNSVVGGVTYTNQQRKVKTTYFDDSRQVVVESALNQTDDFKLKSRTSSDQLGRVITTEGNEDGMGNYTISAQTVYAQMGLITLTSNPKRNAAATTDGWTRTTRDTLGRVTEVATFSGAAQPPSSGTNSNWTGSVTSSFYANQTTVTDQAGKMRRSVTDGLGRLAQVIEDPNGLNYQTNYFYDSLGNLRKVEQGAQTRWFAYDSLSRLIYAMNPEHTVNPAFVYTDNTASPGNSQWSMKYTYQANGNLATRVDARNITTTYGYDGLNRNTSVNYSDSTPDITRTYDTATLGKGRLRQTETVNGSRVTINAYDAMGRPLSQGQQFYHLGAWGSSYTMQQTYNLAGGATSQTYPSNHTTTTNYDAAGRVNAFSGNLGDGVSRNYATITQYSPAGQKERESYGTDVIGMTPLYLKLYYNGRLQLAALRLGTDSVNMDRGGLDFYYGLIGATNQNPLLVEPNNNGNLLRQWSYVPKSGGGFVTTQLDDYTYDSLNRLATFTEGQIDEIGLFVPNVATQNFAYDRYGNRRVTSATGGVSSYNPTYDTDLNNNRIVGLGYDAAGNITSDPMTGGTMTYDAENRLLTATNGGGGSYVYNGDSKRVKRITAGQEWWYVYGIGGELVAEYSTNAAPAAVKKEYGYRGGQLLITADSGSTANLALGKPATQSSTAVGGVPSRGVDGNTNGNWADNSVTHTNNEHQPWWQVDLGSVQQIGAVKVWNRTDCCSERLSNFFVLVSDTPFVSTDLATTINQAGVSAYFTAGPVANATEVGVYRTGRYVRVQLAGDNFLHLAEVEIRGGTGVQWLVSDHLGSTRMVIDQTGSLSGIKRHDYAPFGEELTAGIRSMGGYGYVGSNTRQKFTDKERDDETGLDFFGARYYASVQGRFTSPDPLEFWMLDDDKENNKRGEFLVNPQKWNKYAYVLNNPLKLVDPNGLADIPAWEKLSEELQGDLAKHGVTKKSWDSWNSDQRQRALNARATLIGAGVWDHVTSIVFGDLKKDSSPTFTPNSKGWFLAITTSKDIGPDLKKAGWSDRENPNHPENRANWMQGNFGIVMHLGMLKAPADKYSWIHWDAGGGWAMHPVHLMEFITGKGATDNDDVSRSIGGKYLKGISDSLDKALAKPSYLDQQRQRRLEKW